MEFRHILILKKKKQLIRIENYSGAYDGIGGTLKREAAKRSLQSITSGHIRTAEELFQFCNTNIAGIKTFFVSKTKIRRNKRHLNSRFSHAKVVKGTRSNHCFIPVSDNKILLRQTSFSQNYTLVDV